MRCEKIILMRKILMQLNYFIKIRKFTSVILICLVYWGVTESGKAADQVEFPKAIPACPADYLTDGLMASDGSIWVTSEGNGIYRYFPGKNNTTKDAWLAATYYSGLPDTANFYALAEDKQGRIWAGSDNKGVIVFNGAEWKVYDRENALIGERVFDIAVSPKTGDVAVATSGGISIYDPNKENWFNLTRAEGLAEDQIKSLTYDAAGDLWIAYSCGGVTRLSGKDNYKVLQTVQAPWYWDEKRGARQPLEATGEGIPSNLCNVIQTLPNGGVAVGTSSGLGWMGNRQSGKWKFLRGQDYMDKNKGLMGLLASTKSFRNQTGFLLPEDYVTSLAWSNQGLWVGFREKGAILLDPSTMRKKEEGKFSENIKTPWVTSMLTMPDGAVYATTYGFNLVKIAEGKKSSSSKLDVLKQDKSPEHPQIAKLASEEAIMKELEKRDQQFKAGETPIVFWKEDWATQGDWCERYGTHRALLCATAPPQGDDEIMRFEVAREDVKIDIRGEIGPNKDGDKGHYLLFFQGDIVDDPNVLYNPKTGTRAAARWVDRKEEQVDYKSRNDGPDLWTVVDIPEGKHEVSLYFHNYGEREGTSQGYKDYLLEVRSAQNPLPEEITWEEEVLNAMKKPVLARTRISDFKGCGVYKSFFAGKGGRYYFRIVNNYSSLTILNAVFVTRINPEPVQYSRHDVFAYGPTPPHSDEIDRKDRVQYSGLLKMWDDASSTVVSGQYLSKNRELLYSLYRRMHSQNGGPSIISNWRWFLRMWSTEEHNSFEDFMLKTWYAVQDRFPTMRSEEFFPYSPRTIPFSPREIRAMKCMGINWKDYLPDSRNKPIIDAMKFKEKISKMTDEEYNKMEEDFLKKQNK